VERGCQNPPSAAELRVASHPLSRNGARAHDGDPVGLQRSFFVSSLFSLSCP